MRGSYLPDKKTENPQNQENSKEEVRLQVFLAHAGVASRRASEKIILDGRVAVNGLVVTELGTKVSSKDKITLDGKELSLEEQKRYVLLYKPLGYVCTQSDEKGRPCAVDLLREKYSERLYNVGRLDMFSHGALLFTNDGDFAARLSHPSAEIEKEYVVESSLPLPRYLAEHEPSGLCPAAAGGDLLHGGRCLLPSEGEKVPARHLARLRASGHRASILYRLHQLLLLRRKRL